MSSVARSVSVIKKPEDMEGSEHGPATVGAKKVIASPEEELSASPEGGGDIQELRNDDSPHQNWD